MYTRYRHLAIARSKGEPTEEQIGAIEELLGVKLPEAFLEFLRVANGGYLEYLTDSPRLLGSWGVFSTEDGSHETFLHEIRSGRQHANIPDAVLPFARDGGGSVLYLDLTERGGGRVVAFVRGKPAWAGGGRRATEDAFVDMASSFDEFVSKLYVDRGAAVDHLDHDARTSADVDDIEAFLSIGLPDWRSDDELCAAVDAARRSVAEGAVLDLWGPERFSGICNLAIEEAKRRCRDMGRSDVTLEDVLIALLGDSRSDFALLVDHFDLDPSRLRDAFERDREPGPAGDADRFTLSSLVTDAWQIACRYGWPKVRSAALFACLPASRHAAYLEAIPWDYLDQNLPEILWILKASEGDPTAPRELVGALTRECTAALERAIGLAKKRGHAEARIEHLLRCFFDVAGSDVATWVDVSAGDGVAACDALERELEGLPTGTAEKTTVSWRVWQLLSDAFAAEGRNPPLRTGAVVLRLLVAPHGYGFEHLAPILERALPNVLGIVDYRDLHPSAEQAALLVDSKESAGPLPAHRPPSSALDAFCVDLTALARAGNVDSAFGRETEIQRIIDVLAQRRRNNPLLVGESGVGKTALVHAIARIAVEDGAPSPLRNARILQLDASLLEAGAREKVEVEERMSRIVKELGASPDPVYLVLDEARALGGDAANVLKSALVRGQVRAIVCALPAERAGLIEPDRALDRCFDPIHVAEPSSALALTMLRGLRPGFEGAYDVVVTEEAERAAVDLSVKFFVDRRLPDKALDILDSAAARVVGDRARRGASCPRVEKADVEACVAARMDISVDALRARSEAFAARTPDGEDRAKEVQMVGKAWTPEQIPASFWEAVVDADGDRDKFLALLKQMTRTQIYDFYVLYDRAANYFTSQPYADRDASEDDIFDIANWIVAQGKDYYFDILAHPENTPHELPNDRGLGFMGAIGTAYYELFGEELDP